MKKTLLTILLLMGSTAVFANGQPLSTICSTEKGKLLTNRTIQNFNVTRSKYINYRLSGEGSVWYFMYVQNSPESGIEYLYDFMKVAYLTGDKVDVCLYADGNTLGMERAKGAN